MPLPKEVQEDIKLKVAKAESYLPDLTTEIEKAHRAGIDVTEQRKTLVELKDRIRKMKAVYG